MECQQNYLYLNYYTCLKSIIANMLINNGLCMNGKRKNDAVMGSTLALLSRVRILAKSPIRWLLAQKLVRGDRATNKSPWLRFCFPTVNGAFFYFGSVHATCGTLGGFFKRHAVPYFFPALFPPSPGSPFNPFPACLPAQAGLQYASNPLGSSGRALQEQKETPGRCANCWLYANDSTPLNSLHALTTNWIEQIA